MPNAQSAAMPLDDGADLLCSFNTVLGQQFECLAQAVDAAQARQTELDVAHTKGELECSFELQILESLLVKYLETWSSPSWRH
jgi:hypothetical protein